jgi:hypothetical protein
MTPVAVAGPLRLGAFRMRGIPVAQAFGWDLIDTTAGPEALSRRSRYDTIILVKYHHGCAGQLRRSCRRLIYDVLDAWPRDSIAEPALFWQQCRNDVGFDDIVVTTPSALQSAIDALPPERVHLLPHHADPRIPGDWYDKRGPIVYAGHRRFVRISKPTLLEAARRLGREFVVAHGGRGWRCLRGASLAVALRLPPTDTPLNRIAKPAVKLENAAAAGLPVLASNHPCVTSVRPEVYSVPDHGLAVGLTDVSYWTEHLARALVSVRLKDPVTLAQHLDGMAALIGNRSR